MGFLSGIMGLLVPGSGQVFNRKYEEGLIVFGLWMLWLFVSRYLLTLEITITLIGWFVFAGYSGVDAFLFNRKIVREEYLQLKEFDEMQKQRDIIREETEKQKETEIKELKQMLEKNLSENYNDFQILEIQKKGGGINAKVIIEGKYFNLGLSKTGEIISKK